MINFNETKITKGNIFTEKFTKFSNPAILNKFVNKTIYPIMDKYKGISESIDSNIGHISFYTYDKSVNLKRFIDSIIPLFEKLCDPLFLSFKVSKDRASYVGDKPVYSYTFKLQDAPINLPPFKDIESISDYYDSIIKELQIIGIAESDISYSRLYRYLQTQSRLL